AIESRPKPSVPEALIAAVAVGAGAAVYVGGRVELGRAVYVGGKGGRVRDAGGLGTGVIVLVDEVVDAAVTVIVFVGELATGVGVDDASGVKVGEAVLVGVDSVTLTASLATFCVQNGTIVEPTRVNTSRFVIDSVAVPGPIPTTVIVASDP